MTVNYLSNTPEHAIDSKNSSVGDRVELSPPLKISGYATDESVIGDNIIDMEFY